MTSLIDLYTNRNNLSSPFELFNKKSSRNSLLNLAKPYLNQTKKAEDDTTLRKSAYLHLGISTIVLIGASLILSKGVQKQISKGLDKIKSKLEYRLENNLPDKKNKFSENVIRGVASFIKKTESINNITSLKDILFMRLMYKTKPTKKLHQVISKYFDKLSIKTVEKAYKKTAKAFATMDNKFKKLDEYILKNSGQEKVLYNGKECTVKELLELSKNQRNDINFAVNTFISPDAQKKRNIFIQDANSKLYETFWDVSFKDFATRKNKFKRKEMWQTFIAAEQIRGDKTHLADNVSVLRNMISFNSEDKSMAISKHLQEIKKIIPGFDHDSYNQVKKLEWFVKNSEGLENNKETFLKELDKLTKQGEFKNMDKKIVDNLQSQKQFYANLIKEVVQENGKGQIQDLISIYYKIAPFEFSKSGALQSVKNALKTFDKSVNLEISEYFDKVRDLKLGSAPTDVLTVLLSTGLVANDLHKAKDNKQKTSVMLTSGIPLVGAVATTIIAASKLISGGKSIALGVISGAFLNVVGKSFDKLNKKSSLNTKNNIKSA